MKRLLVVVDYQNDFVNGALGFDKAELLDGKIAEKISHYRNNGDDVVFTYDTHSDDYFETQEGKKLPVKHCVKNTEGWDLFGKTLEMKLSSDKTFEKKTFGSLELGKWLENNPYDSVELVGLVSNICVLSNAVVAKAALPEAVIIVDAECTDAADKTVHDKALDVMEGLQIEVINRR